MYFGDCLEKREPVIPDEFDDLGTVLQMVEHVGVEMANVHPIVSWHIRKLLEQGYFAEAVSHLNHHALQLEEPLFVLACY